MEIISSWRNQCHLIQLSEKHKNKEKKQHKTLRISVMMNILRYQLANILAKPAQYK